MSFKVLSGDEQQKFDNLISALPVFQSSVHEVNLVGVAAGDTCIVPIGDPLPNGALLIGAELAITEALTAENLQAAWITVQGEGDDDGAILSAADGLAVVAHHAAPGCNPYHRRSGQQITAKVSLAGATVSGLTHGKFSVALIYSVA